MSRRELKQLAKSQIKDSILILFFMGFVANIVAYISMGSSMVKGYYYYGLSSLPTSMLASSSKLEVSYFVFAILSIILSPLQISIAHTYLKLSANHKPHFSMLEYGFKNCWIKSVLLTIVEILLISLWSLLLVIPGIIKAYSYSMAYYIMADNPDISALDAIRKSKEMMRGHKFELFILNLSFLPWILLQIVTFGLASIYVEPYIKATETNFYLKLKKGKDKKLDYSTCT